MVNNDNNNNNDNSSNKNNGKSNEHDNDEKANVSKADLSTLPLPPGSLSVLTGFSKSPGLLYFFSWHCLLLPFKNL